MPDEYSVAAAGGRVEAEDEAGESVITHEPWETCQSWGVEKLLRDGRHEEHVYPPVGHGGGGGRRWAAQAVPSSVAGHETMSQRD